MRTIKLLLLCLSAICAVNVSAQITVVPEQKIVWLDLQQNRTTLSAVADLSPSLVYMTSSPLPYLAFRVTAERDEKFIQPDLVNIKTTELNSSFFDNEQLVAIGDDFEVIIESIQSDKKKQSSRFCCSVPEKKR